MDESAIDMTTDDGRMLEVWTISSEGPAVRASAPRLEVREGMQLECRVFIDGLPHRIVSVIEEAEMQSQSRAALILRVSEVALDGQRRRSKRVDVSFAANLTALICDRLVPGEHLAGMIGDVSEGGVAISVPDVRPRDGDRLRMRARAFEGTIDCELRIVSARAADSAGSLMLGLRVPGAARRGDQHDQATAGADRGRRPGSGPGARRERAPVARPRRAARSRRAAGRLPVAAAGKPGLASA